MGNPRVGIPVVLAVLGLALLSLLGPDHCPITQDDFDDLAWEAAPVGESGVLGIRNLTAHSFEARGVFAGTAWLTLHRQDDPHGYYD